MCICEFLHTLKLLHASTPTPYTTPKDGNEGGMQMCLDRLFLEAEEERVEQENRERQQAEQVAAGVII